MPSEGAMAIFHLHVKNISRSEGRSVVAAAAYRSGTDIPNQHEDRIAAFGKRGGVVHTEIVLPPDAPAWMADRTSLWNGAERMERRRDARLAKEVEVALPRELPTARRLDLVRQLAGFFVARGHVIDIAIHGQNDDRNPHAHLLLATRTVLPSGFGGKIRASDSSEFVNSARVFWARAVNSALAAVGSSGMVDHRSNAAAGIAERPGKHRGPNVKKRGRDDMESYLDRLSPATPGREGAPDDSYPIPGPDLRPIAPSERDAAEQAMLVEMERQNIDPDTEWWLSDTQKTVEGPVHDSGLERESWWDRNR